MSVIISGFLILFFFRLAYGYLYVSETGVQSFANDFSVDIRSAVRNYASEKLMLKKEKLLEVSSSIAVDQKYEKVASLSSKTRNFDSDEATLRKCVSDSSALIQFEQNRGLAGGRALNLIIGVQPEKFDSLIGEINKIGTLVSIEINKIDKTNEYKDLKATRASLEKARASLENLRKLNGSVQEMIALESKILETEESMQKLGVQLKEFDEECEFCTVKFTLMEYRGPKITEIPLMHRIKVAFQWSVVYYTYLLAMLSFALFISLILIIIIEKLKWLPAYLFQSGKDAQ
jgi:hypothetical protein